MSKDHPPAISIHSGEVIAVETAKPGIPDEVFTKDYNKEPYPKRILTITGPIYVENTAPGDLLRVTIQDIQLDTMGKMWTGQWIGLLMDEIHHCHMRKVPVQNGTVFFSDKVTFPVRPMIGTLGTAPAGDPVECLLPGEHGGNMDALNITCGNTVYLPVNVPGAYLAVGDVHAAMGHGEVLGTGIEIGSTVVLQIDVIKGQSIRHPIVETATSFDILVSGDDLTELCKEAVRSAIAFVSEHNSCDLDEAYALVGQTADLKIEQIVNPQATISMEIPKAVLLKKDIF